MMLRHFLIASLFIYFNQINCDEIESKDYTSLFERLFTADKILSKQENVELLNEILPLVPEDSESGGINKQVVTNLLEASRVFEEACLSYSGPHDRLSLKRSDWNENIIEYLKQCRRDQLLACEKDFKASFASLTEFDVKQVSDLANRIPEDEITEKYIERAIVAFLVSELGPKKKASLFKHSSSKDEIKKRIEESFDNLIRACRNIDRGLPNGLVRYIFTHGDVICRLDKETRLLARKADVCRILINRIDPNDANMYAASRSTLHDSLVREALERY